MVLLKYLVNNMYELGKKSQSKLLGINPILAFAVTEAIKITEQDFTVFEGVRSLKRQKQLVKRGVSWTMNSNHLTGNAVDLVVWKDDSLQWDNVGDEYKSIAIAMHTIIDKYNLPIEHGYDLWGKDYPHWQVNKSFRDKYNVRELRYNKLIKLKL